MGERRKQLNIGQLCRQKFGEKQCALIGFGTHSGTVAAADDWDGDMKIKVIRILFSLIFYNSLGCSPLAAWQHRANLPQFWGATFPSGFGRGQK